MAWLKHKDTLYNLSECSKITKGLHPKLPKSDQLISAILLNYREGATQIIACNSPEECNNLFRLIHQKLAREDYA